MASDKRAKKLASCIDEVTTLVQSWQRKWGRFYRQYDKRTRKYHSPRLHAVVEEPGPGLVEVRRPSPKQLERFDSLDLTIKTIAGQLSIPLPSISSPQGDGNTVRGATQLVFQMGAACQVADWLSRMRVLRACVDAVNECGRGGVDDEKEKRGRRPKVTCNKQAEFAGQYFKQNELATWGEIYEEYNRKNPKDTGANPDTIRLNYQRRYSKETDK